MAELTQQRLKEVLQYTPETGEFMWLVTLNNRALAGAVAGCVCKRTRYRKISIDQVLYLAHRLAWLYVHGRFPEAEIDHRNGVRDDNRIDNLRDVTHAVNTQNRTVVLGASGALGVSVVNGRFRSKLERNGKQKCLGRFDTIEEASAVYLAAREAA